MNAMIFLSSRGKISWRCSSIAATAKSAKPGIRKTPKAGSSRKAAGMETLRLPDSRLRHAGRKIQTPVDRRVAVGQSECSCRGVADGGAWPSDGPESEPDPAPDSIPDPPPARTDSLRCDRGLSSQMPEPRHQAAHPGQIQNVHQSTRGLLHEPRVPLYRPAGGPRHGPLLRRLERRQEGKGQKARTAQELCPVLRETEMAGRRHCQGSGSAPESVGAQPKDSI